MAHQITLSDEDYAALAEAAARAGESVDQLAHRASAALPDRFTCWHVPRSQRHSYDPTAARGDATPGSENRRETSLGL